jgi:hypothetical protein
MNLAQNAASVGLEMINRLFSGASLTMYSGTQPATPETALSGNTALVAFTYASPAFSSPPTFGSGKETASASFAAASVLPEAAGTTTFARATLTAATWTASHTYAYGTIVSNSSNFYLCVGGGTSAASGGPTASTEAVIDNTVTWNFIGATAGQGNVLADFTCGTTTSFDIQLGSTTITLGVPVDISSYSQSLPAV